MISPFKTVILEDSYLDIATHYHPWLSTYVKQGILELYWIADIPDIRHITAIDSMRELFSQKKAVEGESIPRHYNAIYELFKDEQHILTPDEGLRKIIRPGFPYNLQYNTADQAQAKELCQAIIETIKNHTFDLLIIDRRIPRIGRVLHPKKGNRVDIEEKHRYWNGVDVMLEYQEEKGFTEYIVFSDYANETFGMDEYMWRGKIESDRRRYCDKKNDDHYRVFEEIIQRLYQLPSKEYPVQVGVLSYFKIYKNTYEKSRKMQKQWVHEIQGAPRPLGETIGGPITRDPNKAIFRRTLLVLYVLLFNNRKDEEWAPNEFCLGDIAGYSGATLNFRQDICRADLTFADIKEFKSYRFVEPKGRKKARWRGLKEHEVKWLAHFCQYQQLSPPPLLLNRLGHQGNP